MFDWFVSYGEFAEVVADHFRLNLDWDEFFSVVNVDCYANHFWEDYGVAFMGFHDDNFALS